MGAPRGTCPGPDAAAGAGGGGAPGAARGGGERGPGRALRLPPAAAGCPGSPPIPIPIPIPALPPPCFALFWRGHCPWATCSQRSGNHRAGGWQQARLQGAGDV